MSIGNLLRKSRLNSVFGQKFTFQIFLGEEAKRKFRGTSERRIPLIAIQASSRVLCRESSSRDTSFSLLPTPLRSADELVSRIQSMRDLPGLRAVLFLGLPANRESLIFDGPSRAAAGA